MHRSPSDSAGAGAGAGKIAIPRLERSDAGPQSGDKREKAQKERVARACTNCRKRKVKCSGETPHCSNCAASGLTCDYEQARKDRLKLANTHKQALATLLKDLSLRVTNEDKLRIQDALQNIQDDLPTATTPSQISLGKRQKPPSSTEEDDHAPGEAKDPASVGSNEDVDLLDEDLLRDRASRETGYVGRNSEVQWLRSLQREIDRPGGEPSDLPHGPPGGSSSAIAQRTEALHERQRANRAIPSHPVNESTFYLDTDSIELDVEVDPYECPSVDVAEKLFDCYVSTVDKSFPIAPSNFDKQFRKYCEAVKEGHPYQLPPMWLAMLNLVWAIGAKYSHLINAEWRGHERDHLVYMTRAVRLLGLKENVSILSAPDLDIIQATGLLSLYYLVIGHVHRGWVMIGIAIRLALALGLHLRNEDPLTPAWKKEIGVRTWWSLHAIECLLSAVTGRPCVLSHKDCTVDFPQTLSEEQSRAQTPTSRPGRTFSRRESAYSSPAEYSHGSAGLEARRQLSAPRSYFDAHLNVGLITQKALSELYAPRTATQSWEYVQKTITKLLKELEEWKLGALLTDVSGAPMSPFPPPDGLRERLLLRFSYCSIRILITRPCLCRTERRIRDQSKGSASFNQKTAETCVQAAKELTSLLPDEPSPRELYENGPWWSISHNIMQAMAVLLLELSYGAEHMMTNGTSISTCLKKLIRWLRAMRVNDAVTRRAYEVIVGILRKSGRQLQASASELLHDDEPFVGDSRGFSTRPAEIHSGYGQGQATNIPPPNLFSDYYPTRPQPMHQGFDPANVDAQLLAAQPQQSSFQTSVSDQPPYIFPDPVSNHPSSYLIHPFVTNFDQDVPFNLSMVDVLRYPAAVGEQGGQQGYSAWSTAPQQDPSFSMLEEDLDYRQQE